MLSEAQAGKKEPHGTTKNHETILIGKTQPEQDAAPQGA